MDVVRLRAFREFAERGTVTAAAAALHCTPSAVSQQIRSLAADLGVELTEPAGRGLRLTDAGRVLLDRADAVLAAADLLEAELDRYRSAPRGRVRVTLFPSGALMLLVPLLAAVGDRPEFAVDCRVIDVPHAEAVGLLADFDVVVTHYDDHGVSASGPRVDAVPLLREPLDIALPPGHPLTARSELRLVDLAAQDWISVDAGMPVDDVLTSLGTTTGVRPRIIQRINDFAVTEQLVAAGIGVALLPRYSTDWSQLVRRPLVGTAAARRVEALVRRGTADRPGIAAVLTALGTTADSLRRA